MIFFIKIVEEEFNSECYVTAQCKTKASTCRDDGNGADRCLCALNGQFYDASIDECLAGKADYC